MKKFNLLITTILIFCSISYSQDCAYETNGYSKIFKGFVKTTKPIKYQAQMTSVCLIQFTKKQYNDSTFYIGFELVLTKPEYLAVDENSTVSFLLQTDETIKIPYGGELNQGTIGIEMSKLRFLLIVKRETLEKLGSSLIANISISTTPRSGGYFNQYLKKKRQLKLQNAINCILNAKVK